MSQRGIREKNRFDTNGTPYLLVATKRESSPRKENRRHEKTIVAAKRESSPRKGNRRHEKTIVAAKRESSPRKGNRRREKRIVATKENRGTNNGGLRRKIVLTQTAPHSRQLSEVSLESTRIDCGMITRRESLALYLHRQQSLTKLLSMSGGSSYSSLRRYLRSYR